MPDVRVYDEQPEHSSATDAAVLIVPSQPSEADGFGVKRMLQLAIYWHVLHANAVRGNLRVRHVCGG